MNVILILLIFIEVIVSRICGGGSGCCLFLIAGGCMGWGDGGWVGRGLMGGILGRGGIRWITMLILLISGGGYCLNRTMIVPVFNYYFFYYSSPP